MATKKTQAAAAAPEAPAVPEPTHGGVYEYVDGQLNAIEGGPPKAEPVAETAPPVAPGPAEGEGA